MCVGFKLAAEQMLLRKMPLKYQSLVEWAWSFSGDCSLQYSPAKLLPPIPSMIGTDKTDPLLCEKGLKIQRAGYSLVGGAAIRGLANLGSVRVKHYFSIARGKLQAGCVHRHGM